MNVRFVGALIVASGCAGVAHPAPQVFVDARPPPPQPEVGAYATHAGWASVVVRTSPLARVQIRSSLGAAPLSQADTRGEAVAMIVELERIGELDPSSLRLFVDGVDVTGRVDLSRAAQAIATRQRGEALRREREARRRRERPGARRVELAREAAEIGMGGFTLGMSAVEVQGRCEGHGGQWERAGRTARCDGVRVGTPESRLRTFDPGVALSFCDDSLCQTILSVSGEGSCDRVRAAISPAVAGARRFYGTPNRDESPTVRGGAGGVLVWVIAEADLRVTARVVEARLAGVHTCTGTFEHA